MTTTEQATMPEVWTKNRIRRRLKLHELGGNSQRVHIDSAAMICQEIVADYEKRIEAVEMAASQATNDMVADLMALRSELATLKAANAAAKQFPYGPEPTGRGQPLPRRVEIDLFGHVDD